MTQIGEITRVLAAEWLARSGGKHVTPAVLTCNFCISSKYGAGRMSGRIDAPCPTYHEDATERVKWNFKIIHGIGTCRILLLLKLRLFLRCAWGPRRV